MPHAMLERTNEAIVSALLSHLVKQAEKPHSGTPPVSQERARRIRMQVDGYEQRVKERACGNPVRGPLSGPAGSQ